MPVEQVSFMIALIAAGSAVASAVFTGYQARRATDALKFSQQVERGGAVIHFTDRFFELTKAGPPEQLIDDPAWAYQYWSLLATEFYFFHSGILPTFLYSLWMADLAALFSGPAGEAAIESQRTYMKRYVFNYPEMGEFFSELHSLSSKSTGTQLDRAVSAYVHRFSHNSTRGRLWLAR